MADVKISALELALPLTGAEEFPVVQGGLTKKASTLAMCEYAQLGAPKLSFNTAAAVVVAEGEMAWNATDGTVDLGMGGGLVTLQLGQEDLVRIHNSSGVEIPDGAAVAISGSQGQRIKGELADADAPGVATQVIGIATQAIPHGSEGFVTTRGLVRDIDTSGWTAGDELFVSTTPGVLTNARPSAPASGVRVGWVVKKSATGSVYVTVDTGLHLNDLYDVASGSAQDNDSIYFNAATQVWESRPSDTVALRASAEPTAIGSMAFELTSDTVLTVKVKGSDGVVRSATLTLS
jgi:hypothetical protein